MRELTVNEQEAIDGGNAWAIAGLGCDILGGVLDLSGCPELGILFGLLGDACDYDSTLQY